MLWLYAFNPLVGGAVRARGTPIHIGRTETVPFNPLVGGAVRARIRRPTRQAPAARAFQSPGRRGGPCESLFGFTSNGELISLSIPW